jgi:hypothetical protein
MADSTGATQMQVQATDAWTTVEDLQLQAAHHSSRALSNKAKLIKLYKTHGRTIERRWMKNYKDPAKRKKILQAADPQIPATRQPPATTPKDDSDGASHLYPPINIADLSKDDLALVFIHAQVTTAFHSHVWAVLEHTGLDIYTIATENRINQEYRRHLYKEGALHTTVQSKKRASGRTPRP